MVWGFIVLFGFCLFVSLFVLGFGYFFFFLNKSKGCWSIIKRAFSLPPPLNMCMALTSRKESLLNGHGM